jgi:hypothetical protein
MINATIFQPRCAVCHTGNAGSPSPSFKSYATLMASGVVKPFKPAESTLYLRTSTGSMPLPPMAPLSAGEIKNLYAWIQAGAPDGGPVPAVSPTPTPSPTPSPSPTRAPAGGATGTISVRNFAQIRESMAVVTGVNLGSDLNGAADPQGGITSFYNSFRSQLASHGNATEINPSMLLTTTGLASLFCQQAINREKALPTNDPGRLVFNSIDFSMKPAALTADVRTAQIQGYARAFWRRDATAEELDVLNIAFDEALAGRPATSAEVQSALLVTCTAALTSTDFIKN